MKLVTVPGIRLEGEVLAQRCPIAVHEIGGRLALSFAGGPVSLDAPVWLVCDWRIGYDRYEVLKEQLSKAGYRRVYLEYDQTAAHYQI